MPMPRISRAVATPMPPKPRMPQTPPASMRLGLNWLNPPPPAARARGRSRFAAASAMASGVLGHRLGIGAAIAGDRYFGRQLMQRDEIDALPS